MHAIVYGILLVKQVLNLMNNFFLGKSAVITGAASGLGKAFALNGARLGMNLVLSDIKENSAFDEISSAKLNNSQKILQFKGDVSKIDSVKKLGDFCVQNIDVPNFVFNNAGVVQSGFAWEHSVSEWDSFLNINIMGVVHGINIFTPLMLNQAKKSPSYKGRIINTASMAGLVTMPLSAMYSASKQAVVAISEGLYHDLGCITDQVSASVICPFFIPTSLGDKCSSGLIDKGVQTPSKMIGDAFVSKAIAAGKVTPDDLAKVVYDSIFKDQFYIFSHPTALDTFKTRSNDITNARNPTDPFYAKPEIGKALRKNLYNCYNNNVNKNA